MNNSGSQIDLFTPPAFDVRSSVLGPRGHPPTMIIGCSSTKTDVESEAIDLYRSKRFLTAKKLAETAGADIYILSGKHGLIPHDRIISPYDRNLSSMSASEIDKWGGQAARKLSKIGGNICILAEQSYATPVLRNLKSLKDRRRITAPLADIPKRNHQAWLKQATAFALRANDLRALYQLIGQHRSSGKTFLLKNLNSNNIPPKGVYVFLDKTERNFLGRDPRIVRIGTHAVSKGSKATLRSRLRNHMGLNDGRGNHRGSIFRLHVGRAMLERGDTSSSIPTWGQGQSAPASVQELEADHERRVSKYLGELEVFIIEIDDESSKHSMRAVAERQLISLYSEALLPIDIPSANWLGLSSPLDKIVQSGLWNIREVGSQYKPKSKGCVTQIVEANACLR